jgi:predicted Holliday junction resolvase-like endonuclease
MNIPRDVKALIEGFSNDPKYVGECPNCGESFSLKDSGIFYFDNLTPEALTAKETLATEVDQLAQDYRDLLNRIKKRAPKTSLAVNVGKAVEKVAPTLPGFPYNIGDCRFLGEPIDYIVFGGVAMKKRIDELVFADVKTGKAPLKDSQRPIKDAVDHNRVELKVY